MKFRNSILLSVSAFALFAAMPAKAAHQFYPYAETTIPHDHDSGEHPSGTGRADPGGDGDGDNDPDDDDSGDDDDDHQCDHSKGYRR